MRHPVSTPVSSGGAFGCGEMFGGVVWDAVLPGAPEDAHPGAGEDADGVGVLAATGAGSAVDGGGPDTGVSGVVGEACDGEAQPFVAGPAEDDAAAFAGGVGDGADPGTCCAARLMRAVKRRATQAIATGARAGGCYAATPLRIRQPEGASVSPKMHQ